MGLEWEDSIEQDGQADVTSQAVNIPSMRPCSLCGHFATSLATEVHICSNVIVHAPLSLDGIFGRIYQFSHHPPRFLRYNIWYADLDRRSSGHMKNKRRLPQCSHILLFVDNVFSIRGENPARMTGPILSRGNLEEGGGTHDSLWSLLLLAFRARGSRLDQATRVEPETILLDLINAQSGDD